MESLNVVVTLTDLSVPVPAEHLEEWESDGQLHGRECKRQATIDGFYVRLSKDSTGNGVRIDGEANDENGNVFIGRF